MSFIMKKVIPVTGIIIIFCISMTGQDLPKLLSIQLSQGEEVLQIAAQRDQYAALTVHWKDTPNLKRYYILTENRRKGPYDEVIDLQAAFDTTGFIYAARNDTNWYVYDCGFQYGPYRKVSKVRSGDKNHRCLYLVNKTYNSETGLYNRKLSIDGVDFFQYFDYYLSGNGESLVTLRRVLIDTSVYLNEAQFAGNGFVTKLFISDDGMDIGVMQRISTTFLWKKLPGSYRGFIRYKTALGNMRTEQIDFMKTPGDISILRIDNYPICCYSYEDTNGVWKLFSNYIDMNVNVRDIFLIQPLSNNRVAYVARPLVSGPNNLDTEKFYIFIKNNQTIGGPYLEVKQILASPNMSTMVVEARQADGWYLILPNGGLGPFNDIQEARFMGEGILAFKAFSNNEWTSVLITSQGMTVGTIIREKTKDIGVAFLNNNSIQIQVLSD